MVYKEKETNVSLKDKLEAWKNIFITSQHELNHVQKEVIRFQNEMFGKRGDEYFHTLALAGEVGELCDVMKKRWAGQVTGKTDFEILFELADALIYMFLIADRMGYGLGNLLRVAINTKVIPRLLEGDHYASSDCGSPKGTIEHTWRGL